MKSTKNTIFHEKNTNTHRLAATLHCQAVIKAALLDG